MEPPIVRHIRQINAELLSELEGVELAASETGTGGSLFRRALSELRRRLTAHIAVDGGLVLGTLRDSGGAATGTIDRLHREHRALLCRVVELESGACPPEDLPRFARAVREHIELEDGLLAPAEEAMSHVPVWRAEELYERAGGPTEYWVEKWLG